MTIQAAIVSQDTFALDDRNLYLPGLIKYQLADGASEIGCRTNQRPGSLFALGGPTNDLSRPAGQWNEARIVRRGAAIEHWLNGRLALHEIASDWSGAVVLSRFQAPL